MNIVYRHILQNTINAHVLTPLLVNSSIMDADDEYTYLEFRDNLTGEVFVACFSGSGYWVEGNRGCGRFIPI